jgi:hypothetical protein
VGQGGKQSGKFESKFEVGTAHLIPRSQARTAWWVRCVRGDGDARPVLSPVLTGTASVGKLLAWESSLLT